MADFAAAFDKTVRQFERFELTDHAADYGRQTYAGISRRYHPRWEGWALIDADRPVPDGLVEQFYRAEFWNPIQGDALTNQAIAEAVFDWAVQRGPKKAVDLALAVLGLPPTLSMLAAVRELNALPSPRAFVLDYGWRRVKHRLEIAGRDQSQRVFLLGWLRRDMAFAGVA